MKKIRKLLVLCAVPFILGLSGCNGGQNGGEPTPQTIDYSNVTISKLTLDLKKGGFEELELENLPSKAKVTWESTNEAVASVDEGFVLALSKGETTINVKDEKGNIIASCVVIVSENEVPLVSLSFDFGEMEDEELILKVGETKSISGNLKFAPTNTTQKSITWHSDNPEFITVDENGVISAIKAGKATISAIGADDKTAQIAVISRADWVDYAAQAKLNLDFEGKDFYKDGIGKVNLLIPIDGDTAHFTPIVGQGDAIKSRFFGIDTPESTGKVQPYGTTASDFTKKKLKEAKTIVVSSPTDEYNVPSPDSTGQRYVSLIWISEKENATKDELQLLNLMVSQEGLCVTKTDDEFTRYNDLFRSADEQARLYKVNTYSGKKDPRFNYSSDYQEVSLFDLKEQVAASLIETDYENPYDNQKVRIRGAVVGYCDNMMYIQDYYPNDPEHPENGGKYAGINIFCGMSVITEEEYHKRNTYIEVCGLAKDSENFGFQITDTQGRWSMYGLEPEPSDCSILLKAEENTGIHALKQFEFSASELNELGKNKDTTYLFNYVKVTNKVKCNYFNINKNNEITLGFENVQFDAFIPFTYKDEKGHQWITESDFKGKEFYLSGTYSFHKTSNGNIRWQVGPSKISDLVWAGAEE